MQPDTTLPNEVDTESPDSNIKVSNPKDTSTGSSHIATVKTYSPLTLPILSSSTAIKRQNRCRTEWQQLPGAEDGQAETACLRHLRTFIRKARAPQET